MQDRFGASLWTALVNMVPVLSGFLGVFITDVPLSITGGALPPPLLALMPVYFWCLVRPDLMRPGAVFAIGLAHDLLSGGPPGAWTAGFLAAYTFVDRQRDGIAGLSGYGAILGFAAVNLLASSVAYAVVTIMSPHTPPLAPLMLQIGISVLFYVPLLAAMNGFQHRFIGPLRSV